MARELKIPAKGGGWRGRSGDLASARRSGGETDVLGAGDVLDEVYVVHVAVVLVHALAGRSLPLEVSPLRGACLAHMGGGGRALISQSGKSCHVIQARTSINRWPMFVWGFTLFTSSSSLREGEDSVAFVQEGDRQELKPTWKEQSLRHRAICLVRVILRVYPIHSWLLETPA